jgi:hypothetical protein
MTTCADRDAMAYRPLTFWDKVAGLLLLWSFGVLCGAIVTMWIGSRG